MSGCDTIILKIRDASIKALISQGCVQTLVSNGPTILQSCQGLPPPAIITTKGDLLTHDGTGRLRFPVGTDGQFLKADSVTAEGIVWDTVDAGDLPVAVPVDIVDAVNAEGVSSAFSRSDHAHAHGARAGGTLHAVATGAVAGFMSAADKTRHDAHLNPIDVANPHVVTSTQAYVAGGGTLTLNTTQDEFEVDGAALGTGTAGNDDGPDYFTIIRGGVNVLNTAYNAVDLRAHVYSSAINGLDIGPDPALLPNRSTVRIGPDQLQFLRQDRLITTGSPGFFLWNSTLNLDAGIPLLLRSFGGFIDLGGTFEFDASASPFGMGNALLHRATWKNANAVVANLGPSFLFANNAIYQADGAAITSPQARIFFDNATYNVINGGVGSSLGAIGHVSYYANMTVAAGWSIVLRRGLFMQNATVTGTLTEQVAHDIEDLTTATTNIGIRSSMTAGAGKLFIEHTGSALALFGGEVEVDGTFNHDGALFGVRGLAPVAISPAYTVSNPAVRRTIDVASATLTELLEFVGTLALDLQPQGLIG